MALFVKLPVRLLDWEWAEASLGERGLHVTALALAAATDDGWVDGADLLAHPGAAAELAGCVRLGLLELNGRRARPLGWELNRGQRHRPAIPVWMRRQVMERDGFACVQCGATEPLVLDHVHPWSKGGGHYVSNLQVLCAPCNWAKGAKVE